MTIRKWAENFELYFSDLIQQENRSTRLDRGVYSFLFVLSRFYRRIVQIRLWLYNNGIMRNHFIGCLVISIGNLTCGGTGKTPVVEIFAKTLQEKGRKVAILSRGYRSKDQRSFAEKFHDKFLNRFQKRNGGKNTIFGNTGNCRYAKQIPRIPPRVVSDGKNLLLNSASAGDEPYMLATNLPNTVVLVDKNRVNSGLYAIEKFHTDTLIMDDGFQYLNLKAHINILLIDATNPFGNHHVLPRGLLREPIRNLKRADYVFLTKSTGSSSLRHLKNFIHSHNYHAEIIECCHKPLYIEDVFERGTRYPLSFLKEKKIASISAIANPASFNQFLIDQGATIVSEKRFVDHHRFTQQELIDTINDAKKNNAACILTTEKDAVRMDRLDRRDLPILFLRIEIDILSGQENFEQCISRICIL